MNRPLPSSRKALVLDGDLIPALTIARSLGRIGLEVEIVSHLPRPLARWSCHVRQTLVCPDPMREEAAFIAWLQRSAAEKGYALIIPASERTVVPCFRHRAELGALPLALPDNRSLDIALDKSRTFELARQLGIPVPQGITLQDASQLPAAARGLSFPVVIKPARSVGRGEQGAVQLAVAYAFDEAQLLSMATHALRFGEVILQEYFSGQGTGIELIADHGKIVYAFQHLRLHEVPLTGGGSSLRASVAIEPVLLDAAAKLMAALDWHGVAMVEFKWNPDTREFRLMEINGRFWGSLPLAVAAGADFPAMLYELLAHGKIADRAPATPGMLCRKLSADLFWHEQVLRGAAVPAGLPPPPGRRDIAKSLGQFFSPRHRFDVQSLRDPVPGLVDLGHILATYWRRACAIVQERRLMQRQRSAWQAGHVARALARAEHILFVCYGNINRSVLAERIVLSQANAGFTPLSAGFHAHSGRPADPNMVDVARRHGLDLGNASSRQIDRDMVARADLIFVMEVRHLQRIAELFPEAAAKTFLLGLADTQASPDGEIADPYGQTPDTYERCFKQASACVGRVIELQSTRKRNPDALAA